MKKILLLISIFYLSSSFSQVALDPNVITWAGCGISKKSFMKELAEGYTQKTGVTFKLEGGGATRGIRGVAGKEVMMGGSCRKALPLTDVRESYIKLNPVAWDALAVIIHNDNVVNNVTTKEIKNIYTGKITNWSQLGGADAPIHLFVRKGKISGVGYALRQYVFKDSRTEFITKADYIKKSSGPIEKAVETDPMAIAITGVSSARKRDVKIISIDDFAPTFENISKGNYDYYRPLYLVSSAGSPKVVKDFVKFAYSKAGRKIIRDNGVVPYRDAIDLMRKPLIYGFGMR